MTPIHPEEVCTEEEALAILAHLLVLCPSYTRPEVKTAELLTVLSRLGSEILLRTGMSEIATARNLLAGDAYHRLHEEDGLRFKCLFWIDGDMTATPHHIAALCKIALEHRIAAAGLCCPRSDPSRIAAKRLPIIETIGKGKGEDIELLPVYTGLACMAVPRDEFIELSNHAPWFRLYENRAAPALCQSCMNENPNGEASWLSEDLFYSRFAWQNGNGIYLAPIEFGHLSLVPLTPHINARFLDVGQDEPTTMR